MTIVWIAVAVFYAVLIVWVLALMRAAARKTPVPPKRGQDG